MVGEFAELQGIMGEIYAKLFGEKDDVATAIREHYMPISAEGELPQTKIGAILAIADKLDSIMSFFAVDMIPSGSNDPYALRRQAFGIVRIIADRGWHLPLLNIQSEIIPAFEAANIETNFDLNRNSAEVRTFFLDRIKQLFHGRKIRHDVIDAATDTRQDDVANILDAVQTIDEHKDDESFKEDIEALTRVLRIAKKDKRPVSELSVNPDLFENPSEAKMYTAVSELPEEGQQTVSEAFAALRTLAPVISEYFDENMIMDKNEDIRNNRLAQLSILANQTALIGNLDNLIVK